MRLLSITFILIACLLIAIGKHRVRRARRNPQGRTWPGWTLVLLGALAMIAGVVLW